MNRQRERAALDGLLGDLRSGRGRALVLRGEAGVGKSALLQHVVEAAADMRVVRAAGVESEMELAFAGLHLLCAPLLDRLEALPGPQRDALGVAFGLRKGDAPDRFLVGLAVLTLLSETAEERALLCVVDDAQWLDQSSAQVLTFVARRLFAEPVGLIFAAREPGEQFRGLADLEVRGLPKQDAHTLLRSVVRFPLDERVRDRILDETNGNPLALLELPRGLSPTQLAGGFGLVEAQAVPTRIEEGFRRRLEALPAETRSLMLVAAAEPTVDPALIWRAAGRLGIPASAAGAAQANGLLEPGTRVRFRHPLVRSAVYSAASPSERRAAHHALAEATDRDRDPDRRAWHLASATSGPDDEVAAELERSAERAQARGGMAAAAAFMQRAAELTGESRSRSERALAAAQANVWAGAFDMAAELLAMAAAGPLDELQQVRVELIRGQIAFASNLGGDAPALLAGAAKRLEPLDADLARQTYLEAWYAALFAGQFAGADALYEVSQAARSAPPPTGRPRPSDLLLDGLSALITEGSAQAAPLLRRSARSFAEDDIPMAERLRWSPVAVVAAARVWDEECWYAIQTREIQSCRESGLLGTLVIWVQSMAVFSAWRGDFAEAASLVAEGEAIAAATGTRHAPTGAVMLAGFRGVEAEAVPMIEAVIADARAANQGVGVQFPQWVAAILYNGLGHYEKALAEAQAAQEAPLHISMWALPDLIEAAHRTGQTVLAADALGRLAEATGIGQTDWGQGIYARSRALLSEGEDAERWYREAVNRLGRTGFRPELGRAHLLYGEWLRHEGRRADARTQLRTAHDIFTAIGMQAFAGRARRELLATGESVRRRTAVTRDQLTPQESQIAGLARAGLSNPEIAAQLFLSPRTVEYHLSKVFAKLDITSRRQLPQALTGNGGKRPMT
ncbi:AAA family ATPase [Microbispora sp. RL4-1S]|uniref:AAA family ATPase n=1 Tax=Microbispora oryzae TaxID=2806554 RepID=A0A940WLD0_9ACTN|nr:helix-turn-helix transcriptional regulator [Microbispora oryzae]MBP2705063.1 AAA family ATPase [Microbispora oryzae]